MAYWAKIAAIAAGFGVVITGIGVILVRQTLAANRAAVAEASKAAKAAQQSADVSEDAFRRLERPYLFVRFDNMSTHMLRVKYVPHGIPYLTFKLVNYGKMPAVLRSIAVEIEPSPTLPLRLPMHTHRDLYEVIEQGAETKTFPRLYVKGGKVGEPWLGVEATKLIFHGSYTYEDPTGALHIDRFCMRGTENSAAFVIEGGGEYNWRKTEYPKPKTE